MIFECLFCDEEKGFKNDEEAEKWGWHIMGYNMTEGTRYARCPECHALAQENEEKEQKRRVYILPPVQPKTISKNAAMFEEVSSE